MCEGSGEVGFPTWDLCGVAGGLLGGAADLHALDDVPVLVLVRKRARKESGGLEISSRLGRFADDWFYFFLIDCFPSSRGLMHATVDKNKLATIL